MTADLCYLCDSWASVVIVIVWFRHWAFSVVGLMVWNLLPDYLRDPSLSIGSFRSALKTFLLQCTGTRSAVEALCVMRYTSWQSSSSSYVFIWLLFSHFGRIVTKKNCVCIQVRSRVSGCCCWLYLLVLVTPSHIPLRRHSPTVTASAWSREHRGNVMTAMHTMLEQLVTQHVSAVTHHVTVLFPMLTRCHSILPLAHMSIIYEKCVI